MIINHHYGPTHVTSLQHNPVPGQSLALSSNANASPTPQNDELLSKVADLVTALQKAEQEASSAKAELSKLKANLDKTNKQAAKEAVDKDSAQQRIAPDFGNFDVTVRAKVLVDRK